MNKIIIFTKAPVPGKVKTRLCPPLTPKQAAMLYMAFVKDTLETARNVAPNIRVEIAYEPHKAFPNLSWASHLPVSFFPQEGSSLGVRLKNAFNRSFKKGAKKVVIIGSDTPHLETRELKKAFLLLDKKETVLGPAKDGGYYLVGLNKPRPVIFEDIPWSTGNVFEKTLNRIREHKLSIGLLPAHVDIDTYLDLKMIASVIARRKDLGASIFTRFALVDLLRQGVGRDSLPAI